METAQQPIYRIQGAPHIGHMEGNYFSHSVARLETVEANRANGTEARLPRKRIPIGSLSNIVEPGRGPGTYWE